MMNSRFFGAFTLAACIVVYAAAGPTDGSAPRTAWQRQVKDFHLLFEHYIGNTQMGVGAVLPPVVLTRPVEDLGYKELAFVAGSRNSLWAIDSEIDKPYWEKHFDPDEVSRSRKKRKPVHGCVVDLTAAPALPVPPAFHSPAVGKPRDTAIRFGQPRPVYLLTGDGLLRQLNQRDGSEPTRPRPFVPPGVVAKPLNVYETVAGDIVYTSTRAGCGQEAAVWSLDAADPDAHPKSTRLGSEVVGTTGVALDADGRAFVQTAEGPLDPVHHKYGGSLVELDHNLAVTHYFVLPALLDKRARSAAMNETSPVLFTFNDTELVVTANNDGRLYVLRASDLGGVNHNRYVSKTLILPAMDGEKAHGIYGNLATWEDADGARFVLATVWGPLSTDLLAAVPDTKAPNGSIVVFKIEPDKIGAPQLKPLWISHDLATPTPPVIDNGVVFVLANGNFFHSDQGAAPHRKTHATLYAFDGLTGSQIYSTGDQVKVAGNLTGLSLANGKVYFMTVDNTLEVFGKSPSPPE